MIWPFKKKTPAVTSDKPQSFGYKMTWYAFPATEAASIAGALEITNPRSVPWAEGVEQAYLSAVMLTPSIDGWVLVAGESLGVAPGPALEGKLVALSKEFGKAQVFSTHRVSEYHLWASAEDGRFVRGVWTCGQTGEEWFGGEITAEEVEAGFRFEDLIVPEDVDDAYWERDDLWYIDEDTVMEIAGRWSVSPAEIGEMDLEPSLVILGGCAPRLSRTEG